jgi:gliding motility-associated-like protein
MVVLCAWLLPGGSEVLAQNYCTNAPAGTGVGSFSLSRSRTCANLPVTVTNTLAGAQNITYNYQYSGNGLPVANLTPNSSTTYTSPGTFTILQVGTSSATGFAKCETVTILPTEAINFSTQSCENQQVTASFLFTPNTEQYDEVEVDWGDVVKQKYTVANLKAGPIKHQYPGGGASYTISVRGLYNGVPDCNALPTTKPVTPIVGAAGVPQITRLKTIGQTSVEMLIQGPINTDFEVFVKRPDGSFNSLGTYQRDGGKPIYNMDVRTPQCFQVRSVSSCTPTTNSEEYCTISLNASAVQGQNNVTWTPYTGTSPTIIWRLFRNGANLPVPGNTNKNTKSYTDQNNIQCNTPYCYQVTATAGPTEYISNVVCVTGISSNQPNALTNITVSVQGNKQVEIRTTDPNPTGGGTYTLVVSRADGPNGPFKEIGQATNQAVFDDPTARTTDQSYCYQLALRNECGELSLPSVPACTVHLTSNSPGALDWSADSPFGGKPVAEYEVVFIDRASGVEIKRQSVGGNTHFEPDRSDPDFATYRYEIIAISPTKQTSRSNPYELQLEAGIFAPTAFVPNGFNNRFQVKGDFPDDFRLTIYDRWGAVMYSTTSFKDEDGWDGNTGGQPAPAGTYAWRAEVRDKAGKQTVKASSLLLIR